MLPAASFGQVVFLGGFPGSTEPGMDDSDTLRVGGLKAIDQNDFFAIEAIEDLLPGKG